MPIELLDVILIVLMLIGRVEVTAFVALAIRAVTAVGNRSVASDRG